MGCRLPDSDPTAPAASSAAALELTVVVPTFNERANVRKLIRLVESALGQTRWQVIFVDDDSPDGTAAEVKAVAAVDPRVQCLHRVGRRGLAGAVIEGIMASAAPFVAVMDGDLQHDETLLPAMLAALRTGGADLAVGSRYCGGPGADASALGARREAGSRLANWLGRQVLKADLTDPMSGFFMVRRSVVEVVAQRLSTSGFKVLFDIVASQDRPLKIVELPYTFRAREAGDSKLDNGVVVQYLGLLVAKLSKDVISPRFLMFAMVGASGVVVHLAILRSLLHLGFSWAQTLAAIGAMTSNYLINNAVTYRDRRLKGLKLISGYIKFCVLCSVPLAANVAVATVVFERGPAWWVAGLAGAVVAAAWNYVTTSKAVW
ncbi:MAG: glycosyltransferase family 2 protein [Phenylobacterium sp.]|jgi:dolichol-phosphate mannosyltransferase|nr:glycosyltransferase family 2 protein [Phenylobacterium sp.]MCA6339380.1 glycosyltransferase family 2 protein [Phenylobacterium sp.]MCA6342851.1 glycosyltransferase family 2 protein [Phenylobacterium sp.]MCA6344443.1 glycosyltransferase family 2 protein [Phenylobacterium sp.]MCA6348941.1 glycosyltransferase family 2 protein [Phenylobacterium sp.]